MKKRNTLSKIWNFLIRIYLPILLGLALVGGAVALLLTGVGAAIAPILAVAGVSLIIYGTTGKFKKGG